MSPRFLGVQRDPPIAGSTRAGAPEPIKFVQRLIRGIRGLGWSPEVPMRVLMLGWEFPPFISGGLGTACHGLTRALSRRGVDVIFVLPRPVGEGAPNHVRLIRPAGEAGAGPLAAADTYALSGFDRVTFKAVPSTITSPYAAIEAGPVLTRIGRERARTLGIPLPTEAPDEPAAPEAQGTSVADPYTGDLAAEADRYAARCLAMVGDDPFDVIHAHDWLTFPAAVALAARTGRPMVAHVHSTEFDRSGGRPDPRICRIERAGLHAADRVICVSYLTRSVCVHRYGIPPDKAEVIYNGADATGPPRRRPIRRGEPIVLFLGRITAQKGPERFIAAATLVLEKVPAAVFVMAGAGDLTGRMMEMAAETGIADRVLFTGFLEGAEVGRVFDMADVYVMPSVSEPFGIAPLEAIRHDVPVIISRYSGVAEVLRHALTVDPWDTEDLANKIVAVLRHPPLGRTLRRNADLEVRALTWDAAAAKCVRVYQHLIGAQRN